MFTDDSPLLKEERTGQIRQVRIWGCLTNVPGKTHKWKDKEHGGLQVSRSNHNDCVKADFLV